MSTNPHLSLRYFLIVLVIRLMQFLSCLTLSNPILLTLSTLKFISPVLLRMEWLFYCKLSYKLPLYFSSFRKIVSNKKKRKRERNQRSNHLLPLSFIPSLNYDISKRNRCSSFYNVKKRTLRFPVLVWYDVYFWSKILEKRRWTTEPLTSVQKISDTQNRMSRFSPY